MIGKINPSSVNINNNGIGKKNQPQFKGGLDGVLNAATQAIQLCEINPMVNVSVLDLSTAIIPRTVVESETNPYAGFEAFRRESSGLVINCLIPGFIVAGIAKMIGSSFMGGKTGMSSCWADKETIKMVTEYWKKAEGANDRAKIEDTIRKILKNTEGIDGENTIHFNKEIFDFESSVKKIAEEVERQALPKGTPLTKRIKAHFDAKKEIKAAYEAVVNQTHAAENIRINGFNGKDGKAFFGQSLGDVIGNAPKILKELVARTNSGKTVDEIAKEFTGKAGRLVTAKSLLGLGVIIPLALSAQPINRWITEKTSGKKGAPIYKDFAQSQGKELTGKDKAALFSQKLMCSAAMVGVALLSIMKKPSLKMLGKLAEFKGIFPSVDQARLISTTTFVSRIMASEDKNDLREATVRDIATFSAFYFLGDYVAKGIATAIQRFSKGKVELINVKKALKPNANILDKIAHWTKDTALKSSAELATSTKGKQMRAICQIGNIAFSLVALGLLIPKINRKRTDKEHEKELKQMNADSNTINK